MGVAEPPYGGLNVITALTNPCAENDAGMAWAAE